jgi:hypothetical protein
LSSVHTPTHAIVNLALLDRGRSRVVVPALAGAIVPDLPATLLYLYLRLVARLPDTAIFGDVWQRPPTQTLLAPLHSIPIAIALLLGCAWRRLGAGVVFAASLLLHDALDLPLHREDAHRHFWPLSNVRFMSPLSYWDRAHHAALVAPVEIALVVGGAIVLWRRHPSPWMRAALLATAVGMTASWASGLLFWSS